MDSDPEDDVMDGAEERASSPSQVLSDDKAARKRKRLQDDDEEGEEDEEDEDEEEEAGGENAKRKRRRKDQGINPFLDLQAEVDDDEDEDDEEDEEEAGFVARDVMDDDEEDAGPDRAAAHARLDSKRINEEEMDLDKLAKDLKKKYGHSSRSLKDLEQVPQRLLMPSVIDPNLWQIKVKTGRERDIVFSLIKKAIDLEFKAHPLQIISAFERSSLPGIVYVESRSKEAVIHAINGLVGVFKRDPILVPINEMAPLLQLKKKEITITPGSWVRIKRGRYQGDLAQVVDVTENGEEAGLKFIPRIDMNPKEADIVGADGKIKKKRAAGNNALNRPPARFFNPEEVLRIYGKKAATKRGRSWVFQGDTFTDGFIEKDVRVSALSIENVNPILAEIAKFASQNEGAEKGLAGSLDLSALAEAAKNQAVVVLRPGDNVEVFQGEQIGAQGVVETILGDVVTIRGVLDFEGQKLEVPAITVRKRFRPGDHVKVMNGQNVDETGLVVSVNGDKVTFLSDLTEEQVEVFSKDLRTAAEVGSGSNIVGNYELHDLVQLDQQTVGVIYRVERDSFRVLDHNGQVRLVQPHQITMRKDNRRVVSTDANGHELRVGDNVKETDGENRRGVVLHIHQAYYAFLHNRDITQNGGIFVARCRSLEPIAPKGGTKAAVDLSKMNPALLNAQGGAPSMSRGPRDRLIGVNVVIVKGPQKGYLGSIKDVNGDHCRVELNTTNKIVTVEKLKLRRRGPDGKIQQLEDFGRGFLQPGLPRGATQSSWGTPVSNNRTPNPYTVDGGRTPGWGQDGGRTPGWGASGRTPNPYANGQTPAWSAHSQTPNPYEGGKTPAWNSSSRTPNPYGDGGRTPGWNASSRTPNPYAEGGRTPGWNASSRTPNPYTNSNSNSNAASSGSGWGQPAGSATPGWKQSSGNADNDGWGNSAAKDVWGNEAVTPYNGAPTPYTGAPTPYAGAPTPYAGAPTPYVSALTPAAAPTPGNYGYSAPTPGVYSAETPAPYSAPTPRAFGAPTPGTYSAPTPFVSETPAPYQDYSRVGDPQHAFEERKNWLLDFRIPGLNIKFKDNSEWFGGKFDEQQVKLVAVLEGASGRDNHTATVQFPDRDETGGVPIEILQPVYPKGQEYRGSRAVLLQDSTEVGRQGQAAKKGEIVVLSTYGDKEWLCERTEDRHTNEDIEMKEVSLCIWSELDM